MDWKISFLLGAGASRAAGVKTVEEMFADFREILPEEESQIIDSLEQYLQKNKLITEKLSMALFFEILDLFELLGCSLFIQLFKLENNDWSLLHHRKVKDKLKKHIRKSCIINRERVDYLKPFLKYIAEQPPSVDVFTLNYDYTLETAAEYMGVSYTDGFALNWEKSLLTADNEFQLKIYKLHGSIIWYKINDRDTVKLPLINCEQEYRYFFDENISEMMVYPQLTEEVIFRTLFTLFRKKLKEINLLIISGYSFHDEQVNGLLMKGLQENRELGYLIVGPESDKLKEYFPENSDRILFQKYKWEDFLAAKFLNIF